MAYSLPIKKPQKTPVTESMDVGVSATAASLPITVTGDIAEVRVTAVIRHRELGLVERISRIKIRSIDEVSL